MCCLCQRGFCPQIPLRRVRLAEARAPLAGGTSGRWLIQRTVWSLLIQQARPLALSPPSPASLIVVPAVLGQPDLGYGDLTYTLLKRGLAGLFQCRSSLFFFPSSFEIFYNFDSVVFSMFTARLIQWRQSHRL